MNRQGRCVAAIRGARAGEHVFTSMRLRGDAVAISPKTSTAAEIARIHRCAHAIARVASRRGVHWRTLHAAYRRAAGKYKLIDEDPTDGLPLPPVRQTRPFAFSASDLRDIKAQISRPQDWLSFHLLAYTGMRSIEVRRLRWDDINFVKNTLRVTGKQTRRGDDERLVPIHPTLRAVLLEAPSVLGQHVLRGRYTSSRAGEMISETGIATMIKRNVSSHVQRPAGDVCHPIRRAVASSLRRNGVDLDTIDKLLGWAPASMRARRYMDFEPADFSRAIFGSGPTIRSESTIGLEPFGCTGQELHHVGGAS